MTIFAGPNGSGKSTLTRTIIQQGYDLGRYINADDIASQLFASARVDDVSVKRVSFEYPAFHEAQRLRQECLRNRIDFSFETVFSHESKIDLIREAKAAGYTVRLYFVSTENSLLNVARVAKRVAEGGHPVPVEKIIERYRRTMGFLAPACMLVDEAALFDNSGSAMRAVAHLKRDGAAPPMFCFVKPLPNWVIAWGHEMASLLAPLKSKA